MEQRIKQLEFENENLKKEINELKQSLSLIEKIVFSTPTPKRKKKPTIDPLLTQRNNKLSRN